MKFGRCEKKKFCLIKYFQCSQNEKSNKKNYNLSKNDDCRLHTKGNLLCKIHFLIILDIQVPHYCVYNQKMWKQQQQKNPYFSFFFNWPGFKKSHCSLNVTLKIPFPDLLLNTVVFWQGLAERLIYRGTESLWSGEGWNRTSEVKKMYYKGYFCLSINLHTLKELWDSETENDRGFNT